MLFGAGRWRGGGRLGVGGAGRRGWNRRQRVWRGWFGRGRRRGRMLLVWREGRDVSRAVGGFR